MLKLIIHFLLLLCITNAFEFASTNNKIYSGASQQLYHHRAEDVTIIRPKNDLEYILPRTTKPIHYEIYIFEVQLIKMTLIFKVKLRLKLK